MELNMQREAVPQTKKSLIKQIEFHGAMRALAELRYNVRSVLDKSELDKTEIARTP